MGLGEHYRRKATIYLAEARFWGMGIEDPRSFLHPRPTIAPMAFHSLPNCFERFALIAYARP
jgi:hypothetical protein